MEKMVRRVILEAAIMEEELLLYFVTIIGAEGDLTDPCIIFQDLFLSLCFGFFCLTVVLFGV